MSNQQYQAPPRKKTILDYSGVRMSAPPVNGAEKRPSLAVFQAKNGIRVDVYTNVPNDKKNGNIRIDMEPQQFFLFLELLEKTLATPEEGQSVLEFKDFTWQQNQRSKDMVVQTKLMVARDKNGKIYLSVLSFDSERPKIRFFFDLPWKSDLLINRAPATEAQISDLAARAFLRNLYTLAPLVLASEFVEPVKKDKPGAAPSGGNGGGQQRQSGGYNNAPSGGGGGGNNNTSSDDYDWSDDVPM